MLAKGMVSARAIVGHKQAFVARHGSPTTVDQGCRKGILLNAISQNEGMPSYPCRNGGCICDGACVQRVMPFCNVAELTGLSWPSLGQVLFTDCLSKLVSRAFKQMVTSDRSTEGGGRPERMTWPQEQHHPLPKRRGAVAVLAGCKLLRLCSYFAEHWLSVFRLGVQAW